MGVRSQNVTLTSGGEGRLSPVEEEQERRGGVGWRRNVLPIRGGLLWRGVSHKRGVSTHKGNM